MLDSHRAASGSAIGSCCQTSLILAACPRSVMTPTSQPSSSFIAQEFNHMRRCGIHVVTPFVRDWESRLKGFTRGSLALWNLVRPASHLCGGP